MTADCAGYFMKDDGADLAHKDSWKSANKLCQSAPDAQYNNLSKLGWNYEVHYFVLYNALDDTTQLD